MELDDLKAEWARQGRATAGAISLNSAMLLQSLASAREERIRDAGALSGFGFYVWIFFLAAFGLFTASHTGELKFLLPGLALQVWTIAMGALTFHQRSALRALDFTEAPAVLQAKIARLRIARAETVKWGFLTGQIVWWVPFAIVTFKGLFGIDLFALSPAMPSILMWNLIGGAIFIPIALFAGRVARLWVERAGVSNMLLNAIAGRDMREAQAALSRMRRFRDSAD